MRDPNMKQIIEGNESHNRKTYSTNHPEITSKLVCSFESRFARFHEISGSIGAVLSG